VTHRTPSRHQPRPTIWQALIYVFPLASALSMMLTGGLCLFILLVMDVIAPHMDTLALTPAPTAVAALGMAGLLVLKGSKR
jgi:hypothetical protein